MVYKGTKNLRFLDIGRWLGGETTFENYSQVMGSKAQRLNAQKSAKSTAAIAGQTQALANQGGGNIGFTYE